MYKFHLTSAPFYLNFLPCLRCNLSIIETTNDKFSAFSVISGLRALTICRSFHGYALLHSNLTTESDFERIYAASIQSFRLRRERFHASSGYKGNPTPDLPFVPHHLLRFSFRSV